jgi:hypothetical protein
MLIHRLRIRRYCVWRIPLSLEMVLWISDRLLILVVKIDDFFCYYSVW